MCLNVSTTWKREYENWNHFSYCASLKRLIHNVTICILIKNIRHFVVKKEIIHEKKDFFFLYRWPPIRNYYRIDILRAHRCCIRRCSRKKVRPTKSTVIYYVPSLITKRVRFVFRTKNSDARARGKISDRANKNERDVYAPTSCWMNF